MRSLAKKKLVCAGPVFELYEGPNLHYFSGNRTKRVNSDEVRHDSAVLRSRRMIRWLSTANAQVGTTYFFTATFAEDMQDYDEALKRWEKFRRLIVKEFPECRYIAVPEVQKRKTNNWHFHAIFAGLPFVDVLRSRYGKMRNKYGFIVDAWQWHFTELWARANGGLVSRANIEVARSVAGVCWYVAKYLSKELTQVGRGRKNYYAGGRCLQRPEITYDSARIPSVPPSFSVEYKDRNGYMNKFSRFIC